MLSVRSGCQTPSSSLLNDEEELTLILEPSYRAGSRSRMQSASHLGIEGASASCPSLKHAHSGSSSGSTATSAHDPEFRPFLTPVNNTPNTRRPKLSRFGSSDYDTAYTAPPSPGYLRAQARGYRAETAPSAFPPHDKQEVTLTTPLGATFELQLPPSKEERDAARKQLAPGLHAALQAHERRVQRRAEQRDRRAHPRTHWLRRRAASAPMTSVDESPTGMTPAIPPIPRLLTLQSLASIDRIRVGLASAESGSTADSSMFGTPDDDEEVGAEYGHDLDRVLSDEPYQGFRKRVASISLKVDLALFRAKKRLRRGVGMD
ncbi:hypothetical protein BKA62DRAFT_77666 [Auriculariales sp. MPI-PUGE-AT-0066]|nr:hypothetical protein BKA62DRAFT_77666 [Auriculariales sp. MPI-PUGE-AT-0066]